MAGVPGSKSRSKARCTSCSGKRWVTISIGFDPAGGHQRQRALEVPGIALRSQQTDLALDEEVGRQRHVRLLEETQHHCRSALFQRLQCVQQRFLLAYRLKGPINA